MLQCSWGEQSAVGEGRGEVDRMHSNLDSLVNVAAFGIGGDNICSAVISATE
jgi:hypothetical protein